MADDQDQWEGMTDAERARQLGIPEDDIEPPAEAFDLFAGVEDEQTNWERMTHAQRMRELDAPAFEDMDALRRVAGQ